MLANQQTPSSSRDHNKLNSGEKDSLAGLQDFGENFPKFDVIAPNFKSLCNFTEKLPYVTEPLPGSWGWGSATSLRVHSTGSIPMQGVTLIKLNLMFGNKLR